MRAGVLGSAFNPPHIGHLAFAQEALWQLELDSVCFVPTGSPPHKELEDDPGAGARQQMISAAIASESRFEVFDLEIRRSGPSYMSDTLAELSAELGPGAALCLLVGADAAIGLGGWHEPEEIASRAAIGVAMRQGIERAEVIDSLTPFYPADRIEFVDMPTLGISSSMVRERAGAGRPIRHYVPDEVARVIAELRLYGSGG